VSRAPGFFPPSWGSLAHTGPISRTVEDAAIMLDVIAGYDARDGASLSMPYRDDRHPTDWIRGRTIAVSPDLGYAAVDPEVRTAFDAAVAVLRDLGAEVVDIDLDVDGGLLEDVLQPIAFSEQAASVGERRDQDFAESDEDFKALLATGRTYSGVDYVTATHRRNQLRARFVALFRDVDFFVTPTVAVTAFAAGTLGVDSIDGRAVESHLGWSPFTWPINLTGLPAATVPCGFDRAGLPIGMQIVAPWFDENPLLSIASAFESAKPWHGSWPALAT
jgi:aspartyl-tRNA(Asn)/glutamyl-tRNA(Gln) amidotransferase subunit A